MPLTNILTNRPQNENATNIVPGKNQPITQAPKSALKDLTNAKKGLTSLLGPAKPGTSFRTPQVANKKQLKTREAVQIYMDDFCTAIPKVTDKFPEMKWAKLDTDKLTDRICNVKESDILDYESFKADEFVLDPLEMPEIPKLDDLNFSLGEDPFKIHIEDFNLEPMKVKDIPEMDFTDFTFEL